MAETGLNQNWNRDYDPLTGRYIESDPIGLQGGINTYGYVGSSPLRYVDPYGLFDPSTWVGPTVEGIETVSAAAVTAVVGGVVALAFPTPAGDPNRSRIESKPNTRGTGMSAGRPMQAIAGRDCAVAPDSERYAPRSDSCRVTCSWTLPTQRS